MTVGVFSFADSDEPARRFASELNVNCRQVVVHHFPDGESMVRVPVPLAASTAILYRSLDHPNAKLVELLFAASALRENGASHIILVAPYLAYMRQDKAFNPGEAVSQRVIGTLFADHFDTLFTIDPHLHRIWSLKQIMPNVEAISLTAAPILSAAIEMEQNPVLVGPDSESRQWVETIAGPLGLDVLVGEKQRRGDRDVTITIPGLNRVRGRTAILVDDVISSGATLEVAARLLNHAGAAQVEAIASHCLATEEDLRRLKQAGIARIRSTDAVAGATAQLTTSGILANAVRENQILERAMQRCERQE